MQTETAIANQPQALTANVAVLTATIKAKGEEMVRLERENAGILRAADVAVTELMAARRENAALEKRLQEIQRMCLGYQEEHAGLLKDAALGRWYESLPGFKDSVFYGVAHADAAMKEQT